MLIRVSITNFKSFNEETEFNMLASSDQRSHKEHVYTQHGVDLLKTAAIYGANGAGKSNLVKAIAALRKIVLEGGKSSLEELEKFKLSKNNQHIPTTIEVEFIKNEVPYLYGLSIQGNTIITEWLYESGLGKEDNVLFHRTILDGNIHLKFGDRYVSTDEGKFRLKFLQNELLENDTVLFTELNNLKEGFNEIKSAYDWFKHLIVIFPHTKLGAMAIIMENSSHPLFKEFLTSTINSFQTGISEIEVKNLDFDSFFNIEEKYAKDIVRKRLENGEEFIPLRMRRRLNEEQDFVAVSNSGKPAIKYIITKHIDKQNQEIDFSIDEESDGTKRLIDFIPAFYGAIYTDGVVLIDEIDQSIHSNLLKELIKKFTFINSTKGQLIFTTHESNLLDQALFRRDEIWFAEKYEGATKLYPLSDFDIRLDLDIRKGYLNGRFGAIPFLGNLADLNWDQYAKA